jgi:hypothetical protein
MKPILKVSLLMAVVAAGALLAGCGETYEQRAVLVGVPIAMTADEVVAATKVGESEDAIISRLQHAGFAGSLTTQDVDRLREEGVAEPVIDWMLAHPGAEPMRSATIVGTTGAREIVYVEREPDVIIVEREPRVTYSFGVGYTWGHHRHYPRYHGHYRYHRHYPRTRVYRGSRGRVYRYTSGH